jgi:hypothetical protein
MPLVRIAALPKAVAVSLIASALVLAGAAPATASADDSKKATPKASSFAPHSTGRHVYGAPIQGPILHKRHKQGGSTSKASTAKTSGRTATGAPSK